MTYQPTRLKKWTRPSNYIGASWPETYSAGFGQSRDSDCLERSNFQSAWAAIVSVSKRAEIVSENHWAVGWVEWIAIPADDYEALRIADELVQRAEDYPSLNDDLLTELENEEAEVAWAHCYGVAERIQYIRENRNQFEFRTLADLLGCVRGHYFAGYASELVNR